MIPLRKRGSPDSWKRCLRDCLQAAASGLKTQPDVSFCWEPGREPAAVRLEDTRRLRARFNLSALCGAVSTPGGQAFYVKLLCCCAAERMLLGERACSGAPGSYLELLAMLETLDAPAPGGWTPLCVPPLGWPGDRGRPRALSPAGMFCYLSALRAAGRPEGGGLPEEEAAALTRAAGVVRRLAALPEIGYYGSDVPRSSAIWTVGRVEELLERRSACAGTAPALRGIRGPSGEVRTPAQMLCDPERHGPVTALAMRLLALSGNAATLADLFGRVPGLLETANRYRAQSVELFAAWRETRAAVLADDLIAVNRVIRGVNEAAALHGGPVVSGTVHPMGV